MLEDIYLDPINEDGDSSPALTVDEDASQGDTSSTTETSVTDEVVSPEAGASLDMVLLPKFLGLTLFDQAYQGAKEAAAELQNKGDLDFIGPTPENSVAGQIKIVTTAIEEGVDAIMISNNAGDQIVSVVQDALDSGITVVTWDSSIPSAKGELVYISPIEWDETGQVMADMALSILGDDGGKFAILSSAKATESLGNASR